MELLGLQFTLFKLVQSRGVLALETHIEDPDNSPIFARFPKFASNHHAVEFMCDYLRMLTLGTNNVHEVEALMDEEIHTARNDKMKPYHALVSVGEGLPALGIVAAVLGVVKAMGALDESPEVLGHLIGAALVGTFAGIFLSYAVVSPLANKIKVLREKQLRSYVIVKQSLLAFMNGAMPQVALEHGRKTISVYERPSIDDVEQIALSSTAASAEPAPAEAA